MIQWWWLLVVFFGMCAVAVFSGKRSSAQTFARAWLEQCKVTEQFKAEMSELRSELHKSQALAKTHIELNERFEQERNEAWKRYHAAGIAAGNAQAMLLRSLEGSVRELNKYRKANGEEEIKVNPGLRTIVDDFKREHGAAG